MVHGSRIGIQWIGWDEMGGYIETDVSRDVMMLKTRESRLNLMRHEWGCSCYYRCPDCFYFLEEVGILQVNVDRNLPRMT